MFVTSPGIRASSAVLLVLAVAALPGVAQVEWRATDLLQNSRGSIGVLAMAHDTTRGRVVLVGNATAGRIDTWEWDGAAWTQRSPAVSPPARFRHALAFDSIRGQLVLFGGERGGPMNDTWEFDGSNWTQRMPTTSPPARAGHAMAYDVGRGRTVLFAGQGSLGRLADTWEWDGTNWVQASPSSPPSARMDHALAHDDIRGRTVLFGGYSGSFLSDTWEWDGAAWSLLTPATNPAPRVHHAMAYDSTRGVVILVGGDANIFYSWRSDHWEWNGLNWTLRASQQPPLERMGHGIAFDSGRQRMVLFGGWARYGLDSRYPSDTWEWDGNAWSRQALRTNPDGEIADLTFDWARQQVVGFSLYWREAWAWDGAQWSSSQPSVLPPYRQGYATASDPLRSRVVLFGGYNGPYVNDTWEWDGSNWLATNPSVQPPARVTDMTWHSASGRVVLFGGFGSSGAMNDTWEWDGSNWSQKTTPIAPNPRSGQAMADDVARGVVVLFGGSISGVALLDTWEWDGTAWTFRPVVGPQVTSPLEMVYDSARRRAVLSGRNTTTDATETWEWDGTGWTQRITPVVPSLGLIAFDPRRNRTVGYGSDTWEYGPTTPAIFSSYGNGCTGSVGTPTLAAGNLSLPWVGDTLTLRLTGLPTAAPCTMLVGESNTVWGSVGLPFDLGFLGMPGCPLLTPPTLLVPVTASNGIATLGLPIPNIQRFVGGRFYCQGLVLDLPANALGVTVSNGGASRIGGR